MTEDNFGHLFERFLTGDLSLEEAATAMSKLSETHFIRVRQVAEVPEAFRERASQFEALAARVQELLDGNA